MRKRAHARRETDDPPTSATLIGGYLLAPIPCSSSGAAEERRRRYLYLRQHRGGGGAATEEGGPKQGPMTSKKRSSPSTAPSRAKRKRTSEGGGAEDEDDDGRTLFVTNLPAGATEADLRGLLSICCEGDESAIEAIELKSMRPVPPNTDPQGDHAPARTAAAAWWSGAHQVGEGEADGTSRPLVFAHVRLREPSVLRAILEFDWEQHQQAVAAAMFRTPRGVKSACVLD